MTPTDRLARGADSPQVSAPRLPGARQAYGCIQKHDSRRHRQAARSGVRPHERRAGRRTENRQRRGGNRSRWVNLLLHLARQKRLGNRAVRDRKNRVVLEYGGKLHGFKSFCVAGLAYKQTSLRATAWYEADIYAQGNQAPSVISVKYCLFRQIKDGDLMCLAKYSKSISIFLSRQSLLKSAILGKAQQSRNFSYRFCEDAVR